MLKRILSLLLAMILVAGVIPTQSFAAEDAEVETTEAVVEETEAAVEETEPALEETEAAEETEPARSETEPAAEETEPNVEETEPVAEETVPVPEETVPATEESVPVTEETVPALEIEAVSEEEEAALWAKISEGFADADVMAEREPEWIWDKLSGVSAAAIGDSNHAESEYNDGAGSADRIYDNYTIQGTLTYKDVDFYKFTASYYGNLDVLMAAKYQNTVLALLYSDGEEIQAVAYDMGYSNGLYGDLLSGTVTKGTYYLCVLNMDANTDAYEFYINYCPIPDTLHTVTNVVSGVRLRWNKTSGVSKYGIYRSTSKNGDYSLIATTTTNTYIDTTAVSGKTYHYGITAYDKDVNAYSSYAGTRGIIFVGTPDLTLRVNRAHGIGLGWNKIAGAQGYAIYRKSYSGDDAWVRVKTIESGSTTTWDDNAVKDKNGTIYRYTVRALAGSDLKTLSGCRSTGRTMVRLTSVSMNKAEKYQAGYLRAAWSKNSKATGYELRAINTSTGEIYSKTIGNPDTCSGIYGGLPTGYQYKIQVRSYRKVDGVGSFYSAWSTALYTKV